MRCCRRPRGCMPASGCTGGARPRSCRASVIAGAAPCTRRWRVTTLAAYLVAGRDRSAVTELVAVDAATAVRAAAGWCADQRLPRVTVAVPPWQRAAARRLGALADSTRVQCCGNWQVFDWPAVLAALLAERARSEALPAGEALVGIAGAGCLRLWVDGASAGCEPTDAAPQVRLDAAAALRALGGPLPGCFPEPDADTAALRSWCPVPLHIPSADRV